MTGPNGQITVDTNIAIYALSLDAKADRAAASLRAADFLSVQVLSEYANVGLRKRQDSWKVIAADLDDLRSAVPRILPIDDAAHRTAIGICERYRLSVYDALMLSVALSGGARIIYSHDMQHDLVIDGTLRVVDPFR